MPVRGQLAVLLSEASSQLSPDASESCMSATTREELTPGQLPPGAQIGFFPDTVSPLPITFLGAVHKGLTRLA